MQFGNAGAIVAQETTQGPEYDDKAIRFLESLWGEGFLSPGGSKEVDRIVSNLDFTDARVLDLGCGAGGATLHLAKTYPLAHIVGFDVEDPVINRAKARNIANGLTERASFVLGEPGPLPFEDGTFDIVFSKDALVHVADKEALFAEIFRIIRPGGSFAASDWLTSHDGQPSAAMRAYLKAEGLSFGMASPERTKRAMQLAGLAEIKRVNRNAWYRKTARAELEQLKGPLYEPACEAVGKSYVDKNIQTWAAMLVVLESGEHRPTHLFATKPPLTKAGSAPSLPSEQKQHSSNAVPARSRASREFRQQQLIGATIDSIATRGYAETTMAHVTKGAGLSRGIANFHFESKERLFIETLQFMADDYALHWKTAIEKAADNPAAQLRAMIVADFDNHVCNTRKIATWFAFLSEAKTRPAYRKLCWARDDDFLGTLRDLCQGLKTEAGYNFEPKAIATSIYALQEGLWLRPMLAGRDFKRKTALETSLKTLGTLFPKHFHEDGTLIEHKDRR